MNSSEKVTLVREGEGRYEVFSAGVRAGLVMGGGSKWTAEVGRSALGVFPTRKAAVEAVLADAGDPCWRALSAMSASVGLPQNYRSDLDVDRTVLREWKGQSDFLWILRENGTNITAIDAEWTRREAKAVLDAFEQESRRPVLPARAFLVRARTGGSRLVSELSWAAARALLQAAPLYYMDRVNRTVCRRQGANQEVLANILVEGYTSARSVQCEATVTVQLKPAVKVGVQPLFAAAFAYLCHYAGTLFASPKSVRVIASNGVLLDSWQAKVPA